MRGWRGGEAVRSPGTVLGGLALLIATSGVAVAAVTGNGQAVTACLSKSGTLKVIDADAGETCGGTQATLRLASTDASGKVAAALQADRADDADTLDGTDSTAFLRASGAPQSVNLELSGPFQLRSPLRNGLEQHAVHSAGGMVIRAVEHGAFGAGDLVARAGTLRLERDGTIGGLRVSWNASPGQAVIACQGVKADGSPTSNFHFVKNSDPAGSVTVAAHADHVGMLTCMFGRPQGIVDGSASGMPHVTRVTLLREVSSSGFSASPWIGLLQTTDNQ